jgi:hypothetical protein
VRFPLEFDPFWDWNDADRDKHFNAFDDQCGSLAREVACIRLFDVAQIELRDFLLTLLPEDMKGTEFAHVFGVHKAQLGRFQRGVQMPNPHLIHAWLRKYRQSYQPIRFELVYDALAVSAATLRVDWEKESRGLPNARKQRLDLPEVSVKDTVLSYALVAPGDINKSWIQLARIFKDDLYHAIEHPELVDFCAELLGFVSQMFGKAACNPMFFEASNQLANIDLDSSTDVFRLIDDIQRVWNTRALTTHLVARSWTAD